MAECEKYRDLISGYADGELSDKEYSDTKKHLEDCPTCQALLSAYRSISEAAEESMEEPPEDFTSLIMGRIRQLPDTAVTQPKAKAGKSMKPVIISFVAAAACIALAFMISPQLLNFTNSTKSEPIAYSKMVQASDASSAAPEAPASDAAGDSQLATANTPEPEQTYSVEGYVTAGAPNTSTGTSDDAVPSQGVSGQQPVNPPPATAPSAAPGGAAQFAPNPTSGEEYGNEAGILKSQRGYAVNLEDYYAVITIKGQLPDILKDVQATDNDDGTQSLEISAETADQLISAGYTAIMGSKDAATALVVYTQA